MLTTADLLDRLAAANALVNAAMDLLPPHELTALSVHLQLDPFASSSPASALVALRRADAALAAAVEAIAAHLERTSDHDHDR